MKPARFDVHVFEMKDDAVPVVEPWKRLALEPTYAGSWIVTGDLTGDGTREIVSARSVGVESKRYTCSVVAHRLDGTVLWRWGDPSAGTGKSSFDVACQVYDWSGDGHNEVIVSTDREIIALSGRTGEPVHRFAIPKESSDCIVFCNLTGGPRAEDVLVKNRYTQIWAFARDGRQLWTSNKPGGYQTAHQGVPIDIDGDGKDEVLAGYAMLNPDGSVRWVLEGREDFGGHLDCGRVIRMGNTPDETQLVITFCGGNRIAKIDGQGRFVWRIGGAHFESVDVAKVCADLPGKQLVVDVDHQPWGKGALCIFSEDGELIGRITAGSSRHHFAIDWTGDGTESILIATARAAFNGRGEKIARFNLTLPAGAEPPQDRSLICAPADMDGDGRQDVLFWTNPGTHVWVFRNQDGRPTKPGATHSENFTFY